MIFVRGDGMTRTEQEHLQLVVKDTISEVSDNEYPIFELISTYLLPALHAFILESPTTSQPTTLSAAENQKSASKHYHALLTSHHLISPTKRRNLQSWSSKLSITGFAKVGYPGVIYCEGEQGQIEDFVANIKAMQWLALRVRFVEPFRGGDNVHSNRRRHWVEFEKVGEVVEEMRRLGRESYVVEIGIGSVGSNINSK